MKLKAMVLGICCIACIAAMQPDHMQVLIRQLGDSDPTIRAGAREELMGLKRSDLDHLKDAVAQVKPLNVEQIASLHQVVTQIIQADMGDGGTVGFLGASLLPCEVTTPDGRTRSAVLIGRCIPGFAAFRMLRPGDIIMGMFVSGRPQTMDDAEHFTQEILSRSPGDSVRLRIMRNGKVIPIVVELSARPPQANDDAALQAIMQTRQEHAEQYWRSTFVPVVASSS